MLNKTTFKFCFRNVKITLWREAEAGNCSKVSQMLANYHVSSALVLAYASFSANEPCFNTRTGGKSRRIILPGYRCLQHQLWTQHDKTPVYFRLLMPFHYFSVPITHTAKIARTKTAECLLPYYTSLRQRSYILIGRLVSCLSFIAPYWLSRTDDIIVCCLQASNDNNNYIMAKP